MKELSLIKTLHAPSSTKALPEFPLMTKPDIFTPFEEILNTGLPDLAANIVLSPDNIFNDLSTFNETPLYESPKNTMESPDLALFKILSISEFASPLST